MRELRRVTASDFAPKEPTIPDAVMDNIDLARIQQLAGVTEGRGNNQGGIQSPMGSNISHTAMEKRQLEKENNIRPGTPEWFQLWFSLPYLTGEKPVGKDTPDNSNTLMSVNPK
jgi:hypothetical protein